MVENKEIKGLLIVNGPQNSGTAFEAWASNRKTPFNDMVSDFAGKVGDSILHDRKTQLALAAFMIASAGALFWRLNNRRPQGVMGLSLGENVSAAQAGSLSPTEVLEVVKFREGLCAPPVGSLGILERGMAVIVKIVPGELDGIVNYFKAMNLEGFQAYISNINTSTQIVGSGVLTHLREVFTRYMQDREARGTKPAMIELKGIRNAFHSPLMEDKEAVLQGMIAKTVGNSFQDPLIEVYSPMLQARTGDGVVRDASTVRLVMETQLTNPVNARACLRRAFADGKYKVIGTSDASGRTDGVILDNLRELGLEEEIEIVNYSTPDKMEKAARIIEEKTT